MCLPDGQWHNGGNGTSPQSQRDDEIQGKSPGTSIRPEIFPAFSPHDILDDRLIEVPNMDSGLVCLSASTKDFEKITQVEFICCMNS